jgi:hypothetical protein
MVDPKEIEGVEKPLELHVGVPLAALRANSDINDLCGYVSLFQSKESPDYAVATTVLSPLYNTWPEPRWPPARYVAPEVSV